LWRSTFALHLNIIQHKTLFERNTFSIYFRADLTSNGTRNHKRGACDFDALTELAGLLEDFDITTEDFIMLGNRINGLERADRLKVLSIFKGDFG
jgi:hypothetical protein